MPDQMQTPPWVEGGGPASELSTAAGSRGSAGDPCYQNPKCPDRIEEEQKVEPHIARLQELWNTPQLQTVHIPKSMNSPFLKHPELTTGQKRYLCSIAKIYSADSLKTLMKRQYMHVIQHDTQKPGISTHHRSQINPRYSQKQHSPCTTWRHQLERLDSLHSSVIATPAAETQAIQHSLWQPGRNKEGLKCGPLSKARCKSLKIFQRPSKAFRHPAFTNDSDSYMSEEKRDEDLLNKCMQSMSIEEQGENLM
ncbi:protein FAM216A isoform X1 [Monodelphis domestica]|uniref:protein FAM216A isoform X1 n=1 Tax=Monodelphis domestica TaxID=13616 RepID=UPI00028BDB01|nr:protein FAM216A isoform X1 [Monodelphis domestica]